MATKSQTSSTPRCANCGAELNGSFCSQCGQNDKNYDRSLWRVVGDLLREQFDIHSRISRTLQKLFLQPGELAVEFKQNRRASYVAPIRMYLFSSLLFFFLAAIAPSEESEPPLMDFSFDNQGEESEPPLTTAESDEDHEGALEARSEQIEPTIADSKLGNDREDELGQSDEWMNDLRALTNDRIHQMAREVLIRPEESNTRGLLSGFLSPIRDGEQLDDFYVWLLPLVVKVTYDNEQLWKDVRNNLALSMVVLLPWLLLTSAMFHVGSKIRLVHQLVFCMHVFTLAFLVLSLDILVVRFLMENVEGAGRVSLVVAIAILAHTFVAYQNFYENGPIAGFFKFVTLMLLYGFAWTMSFLLVVAYSVYTL